MYIYIKNITKWNEDWQLKWNDGSYCVSLSFRKLTESILIGVELAPPLSPHFISVNYDSQEGSLRGHGTIS